MGQKIFRAFEIIHNNFGLYERMRISMISNIPSSTSKEIPDSPENISKMEAAIKEVLTGHNDKIDLLIKSIR
ncbi:hypothetical protein QUF76_01375 [Desulfobacterales bacterium HSG16]|nr:hypothetical protein [Desulfobacterales bacterium HSG16]